MTEEELQRREAAIELRLKEQQARTEFPQMHAAFNRVRTVAQENLFKTAAPEHEKREELYRLVHILNRVESELLAACGQGSDAIEEWVTSFAPKPATTGNTP